MEKRNEMMIGKRILAGRILILFLLFVSILLYNMEAKASEKETTEYNYIYFGNYPQTEVTGESLTKTIIEASYDTNGDALVNGIKYRRIGKENVNNMNHFGKNKYRYFKWEPIKWRVLKDNGNISFMVADKGLDCKDYNEVNEANTSITWENCTLRNWLNDDFYNMAFSKSDQDSIIQQTVVNENNPFYNTEGGNDTVDKIFLLSIQEVRNSDYGFEDYYIYSKSRWKQVSDYAYVMGARTCSDKYTGGNLNCDWWLRSPGDCTNTASGVDCYGQASKYGCDVSTDNSACVPALYMSTLTKVDITKATIILSKNNYTYDGKAKKPSVTVELNGKTLALNKDYTVSYSNNTKVGTAKVIVKGKGNYKGSITKTFTINKPKYKITCKKKTYTVVYGSKPFKINATSNGTMTYKSSDSKVASVNKSTGKVTIKGTGIAYITVKTDSDSVKVTIKVSPKKQTIKFLKTETGKKLTVKWVKDTKATGYQVQLSDSKNFKKITKDQKIKKMSNTTYTFTKLKIGKKYYIRIRSYKSSGKNTLYGAWSNLKHSSKIKK